MAIILTPINQVAPSPTSKRERELIQRLRVLLKDLPQDVNRTLNTLVEEDRGERWSDLQLLVYLQQAMTDVNAEPAITGYTLEDFPTGWTACIVNGAMIFALIAEGILQNGEQFSYSDNGISLSINLAQGYQSMAQMLLSGYTQLKKDIKRSMRPTAAGVKSSPAPVRIRSYAPRSIFMSAIIEQSIMQTLLNGETLFKKRQSRRISYIKKFSNDYRGHIFEMEGSRVPSSEGKSRAS